MLDRDRVTEDGKKHIERMAREFNLPPPFFGQHGMKRVGVPYGIRITQEKATRSKPWLVQDKPWEDLILGYVSVLEDEGRFRCWYEVYRQVVDDSGAKKNQVSMCYAESKDGWEWTKPSLGVLDFRGSRENNLVLEKASEGAVFRDDHGSPRLCMGRLAGGPLGGHRSELRQRVLHGTRIIRGFTD